MTLGLVAGLEWDFTGPQQDIEYMYALNRHYVFDSLAQAWTSTGTKRVLSSTAKP